MVEMFEEDLFELMDFYQDDLVFWVQFKDDHEADDELRETAREFIVYNEWSIKQVRETVNENRERFREIIFV